jgi:hypothetical protein
MKTIFVFGSNLAGRHGAGAAKFAHENHGAVYGQGYGLQGTSFAIPTKDAKLQTLPLERIRSFVTTFLDFAREHHELTFSITRVGCGLAGYRDVDIAPMFEKASSNCLLPKEWRELLAPIAQR